MIANIRPFPFAHRPLTITEAKEFPRSLDDLDFVATLPFCQIDPATGPLQGGIYRQNKPRALWVIKNSPTTRNEPLIHEVIGHRLINWHADVKTNAMLPVPVALYNSRTMKIHDKKHEWQSGDHAYQLTPYYDPRLGYVTAQEQLDMMRTMMASLVFLALIDYTDIHPTQWITDPYSNGDSFMRPLRLIDTGGSLGYAPHGNPKSFKQGKKISPVPGSWQAPMEHFDILPALYVGLYNPFAQKLIRQLHGSDIISQAVTILEKNDAQQKEIDGIFSEFGADKFANKNAWDNRIRVLRRMVDRYSGKTDVLKAEILTPRQDSFLSFPQNIKEKKDLTNINLA